MDYLSIKNLDKYQPHYRDYRKILWIRWDIDAHKDYKFSKLQANQRWLFIGLITLAVSNKNQIPMDLEWLSQELKYPIKSISNDLKLLQTLEFVVTSCNEPLQGVTNLHLHNITEHNITIQNEAVVEFFDYYLIKTKKAFKLTPSCRQLIIKRMEEGFSIQQLKKAVDNFILDDWVDRHKHLDLIYCIGKQSGKPDNLEKWLNFKPKVLNGGAEMRILNEKSTCNKNVIGTEKAVI